jgi:CRP/FNR family transcriptional regulator
MFSGKKRHSEVPPCEECTIRSTSMFCNLELHELKKLSEHKTSNIYKKGQSIFYEDRQPHGLYCIYSGKVKIHKYGENGQEQILRFAKPGQIIGYRALLHGDVYSASATAMETSSICYFPKESFMELLMSNSEFCLLTLRRLAGDLKAAEHQLTSMAHKMVTSRLAEAILLLKECYGYEPSSTVLRVIPSRRELANIAGTTTETAIRIIADFKLQGLISFDGKRIEIIHLDKLRQLASAS